MDRGDDDDVIRRVTDFIREGNGKLNQITTELAVIKQEVKDMRIHQDQDLKDIKKELKSHNGQIRNNEKDISSLKTGQKIVIALLTPVAI